MKVTEKWLVNNYAGRTNGGFNVSEKNGVKVFWNYRNEVDMFTAPVVADRKDATVITIDRESELYGYHGARKVALMKSCARA